MAIRTTRLNQQADRIELVLAQHKLPVQVAGGVVTPRMVRFNLNVAPSVKLNKLVGLAEEIALALGAASVRILREGGMVRVEMSRDDAETITFTKLCQALKQVPPATAVLGQDSSGAPLLLRLSSPSIAHILVAGTTGSGKTALMRNMLLSLARYNRPSDLRLVLIDPKGRSFEALSSLPHLLTPIITKGETAVELLNSLVTQMEKRDQSGENRPRVVIVIDELADLLQTYGNFIEDPLTRLAQRGREAGFHLIAATQKPSSKVLSTLLRSNFPTRLVGRVASPDDARTAAGIGGTGAEKLNGNGDFILVAEGQTIRFQAAWASRDELQTMTSALRPVTGRMLLNPASA
jgi:S-DNA-T family DNA segregation ATPase FtsK/SpoIIIE